MLRMVVLPAEDCILPSVLVMFTGTITANETLEVLERPALS